MVSDENSTTITESLEKLHLDPVTNEMVSKSELKRRLKKREKEVSKGQLQHPEGPESDGEQLEDDG